VITYVDSSALVKLVAEEPESRALRAALEPLMNLASSVIARVEVMRAARAVGIGPSLAQEALATVALIPVDHDVISAAVAVDPITVRSLDAIHLATALSLADRLGVLVTYDERMRAAADRASLVTLAPR
jgi:predicted nucleic acid-binding protein